MECPWKPIGLFALQVFWRGDWGVEELVLGCRTKSQVTVWEVRIVKCLCDMQGDEGGTSVMGGVEGGQYIMYHYTFPGFTDSSAGRQKSTAPQYKRSLGQRIIFSTYLRTHKMWSRLSSSGIFKICQSQRPDLATPEGKADAGWRSAKSEARARRRSQKGAMSRQTLETLGPRSTPSECRAGWCGAVTLTGPANRRGSRVGRKARRSSRDNG